MFTSEDTTTLPELSPSPYPNMNPHERSGKDATAHQSPQSHWPGRDTCTPTERSCRPASSNANNNLSGIIQPRHRPHCLAPSRCCSRLQKGGPSGTLKLPPYIPHGHLLQTDGTHSHSILNDAQHGFRKKRPCETQLLMVTADIHKALDNNLQMDGILLDFSKAFDKVPHTRLALKLENYSVRGNNLRWIQSFLSDRTQKVVLNGKQPRRSQWHLASHKAQYSDPFSSSFT